MDIDCAVLCCVNAAAREASRHAHNRFSSESVAHKPARFTRLDHGLQQASATISLGAPPVLRRASIASGKWRCEQSRHNMVRRQTPHMHPKNE
jgi:hypothetical protein